MTIVSHRYQFIFIKTAKTAGTSVQMALEKICGEEDICAPLTKKKQTRPNEEGYRTRNSKGFFIPKLTRNENRPSRIRKELKRFFRREKFRSHMVAAEIRQRVGPKTWDDYQKVTIERNPWDKVVSEYFWARRHKQNQMPFEQWVRENRWAGSHFTFYSIGGVVVADRILRYERLSEDFSEFMGDLGVTNPPSLPQAKKGYRKKNQHYRDIHTEYTKQRTKEEYAREIEFLGYEY